MKNHFLISYAGNKRQEVEQIYENINLDGITTIIEPFCGSCAFSYYLSTIHPKKFKYVINDLDKHIIELIKLMQNVKQFEDFITKTIESLFEKDKFCTKEKYLAMIKNDTLESYFISRKFFSIKSGLYPINKVKQSAEHYIKRCLNIPFLNFVRTENVSINSIDGIEIYNKYKDDKHNLIFLDPPYMKSCNDMYNHKGVNVYEYLYDNSILKEKARIYICLENIWIIRLLFKGLKQIVYDKVYQISKKQTTHILIENILS